MIAAPSRSIIVATAAAVVAVAGFAAVVSYSHFYDLGRAHGQDGTSARLTPLSVDLLILAASLVLLWAARNQIAAPWPIRAVLVASVAATVAGNVLDGLGDGPVGAVLNGWPGAAFVAAVEIAMWLVRAWRMLAAGGGPVSPAAGPAEPPPGDAIAAAEMAYAASVAGGNPLSQNQLQTKFGLTRAQAAKAAPKTPAGASVPPPDQTAPAGLAAANGSHGG